MQTLTYHDWTAFVDAVDAVSAPAQAAHATDDYYGAQHWTMGAGLPESIALARNGWPPGRDCVHALASAYFEKLAATIERIDYVHAVTGDLFDVGAYLSGDPECCLVEERETIEGPGRKNLRIVYNGTASGAVESNVLLAKGAAVAALAQLLEFAGHGVEVVLAYGIGPCDGDTIETYVTLKTSDQPMDLSCVAFALAHPATFRRLGFRLWEGLSLETVRRFGFYLHGGYGRVAQTLTMTGDVNIGGSTYGEPDWMSPGAARAWVAAELAKQGVNVTLPDETEEPTQERKPTQTPTKRRRGRARRRYY